MAAIAAELGLSETAFVTMNGPWGSGKYNLRWFTPSVEVALCGHGTLAAAKALRLAGETSKTLSFSTLSGELHVDGGDHDSRVTMAFPFNVCKPRCDAIADAVWMALLGSDRSLTASHMCFCPVTRKLIVRLVDTTPVELLASWAPDPKAALRVNQLALPSTDHVTGVSVTLLGRRAFSEHAGMPLVSAEEVDFVSRYFSPWNGISEDPVNGSSHTILGPYWANELGVWSPPQPGQVLKDSVPGVWSASLAADMAADAHLNHRFSMARLRALQLSARSGVIDLVVVRACAPEALEYHGTAIASVVSSDSERMCLVPRMSRVLLAGHVTAVYSGDIVIES